MRTRTKPFLGMTFNDCLATVRGAPNGPRQHVSSMPSTAPTPQELLAIYGQGFQGVRKWVDEAMQGSMRTFKNMLASMPRLYDVFPWAKGLGKGKVSVPYLACVALIAGWGGLYAQVQGDCTVHGTEHAAEIDYCNDAMWGETKFMGPIAFENIYRSRGFNGDGWSCFAPTAYVGPEGKGGFLYRKVYQGPNGETVDLTKYNSSWQSNGRAGVPGWLEEESRKNKAKWIIPITTIEEYRDAIALGFGINFCSGQAWSSSTDEYGVARAQGSWSHAMAHTGCNDSSWANTKYGGMLGLIQNSWGKWNSINGRPDGCPDLAPGSFWSKIASISRLIDGDQFAVCSVYGWERQGWEAFDVTELYRHLKNSTTQDYYKIRSERQAELVTRVLDERIAL